MRMSHAIIAASVMFLVVSPLFSQPWPPQIIPARTEINARGIVRIRAREHSAHQGRFEYHIQLSYDPQRGMDPEGTVSLYIRLNDTATDGNVGVRVPDLSRIRITSIGRHTPTAFFYAECRIANSPDAAYLYMMLVDNKRQTTAGTPDVVQFVVLDRSGRRLAHGCGPVSSGDVAIGPKKQADVDRIALLRGTEAIMIQFGSESISNSLLRNEIAHLA